MARIMVRFGNTVDESIAIRRALDSAGKEVLHEWKVDENTSGNIYTCDGSIYWTPGNTFEATPEQVAAIIALLPSWCGAVDVSDGIPDTYTYVPDEPMDQG